MIKYILKLLGYELGRDSLVYQHMFEFTNSSWIQDIQQNGNIKYYYVSK
jgi:hypothetical protein